MKAEAQSVDYGSREVTNGLIKFIVLVLIIVPCIGFLANFQLGSKYTGTWKAQDGLTGGSVLIINRDGTGSVSGFGWSREDFHWNEEGDKITMTGWPKNSPFNYKSAILLEKKTLNVDCFGWTLTYAKQ